MANFLKEFQGYHLEDDIKYVVDNSEKKHGITMEGSTRGITVISLGHMLQEIMAGDIILITTMHYYEVVEQLNKEERLRNTDCYLYFLLRIEQYDYDRLKIDIPKNLSTYQKQVIPKVIHYCWFGKKEIPIQYKKWMESWKKYCPDYEIIEWNESNYDIKKNSYMYEAYQAKKWGFVPDYARLDIIYNHGGIYLDTDVEVIKNLDELLYQDAFVGIDGSRNICLGLGFGARPQFQLIKDLRDEYNKRSFCYEDGTIDTTIAPVLQIPFFRKLGYINNGEYQRIQNLSVYPEKVLSGKCSYTGRISPTKNTFLIHHYDGSWNTNESKMRIKKLQELFKKL